MAPAAREEVILAEVGTEGEVKEILEQEWKNFKGTKVYRKGLKMD